VCNVLGIWPLNVEVPVHSSHCQVCNVQAAVITMSMVWFMSRRWEGMCESNPSTTPFEDWVHDLAESEDLDVSKPEDFDKLLLCMKPSQRAIRYCRMKAFGNHFRVEDEASARMQTYDSGVASVFEVPTVHATDISVNYVGVVKDILKLDYGPLSRSIVLLRCQWVKRSDNRGNPTYTRDDAGFLVVNFRHNLPRMSDPFIFAAQATQVFYSDVPSKPGWKVVLRKEARAKREVAENADAFITTSAESAGLTAPTHIPAPPNRASLVGAIQLSPEDQLLAMAAY
jgi:hypothetical protein